MMGNQPIHKTIDGENFIIAYLDPDTAIDLLCKIATMVVPTIGSGFKGQNIDIDSVIDKKIDISLVIDQFFKNFNSTEVKNIIKTLLSQVIHKGEGNLSDYNSYNKLFSGRLKFLFKVVYSCLEVQYADFFDGKDLKEIFSNLKTLAKSLKEN